MTHYTRPAVSVRLGVTDGTATALLGTLGPPAAQPRTEANRHRDGRTPMPAPMPQYAVF